MGGSPRAARAAGRQSPGLRVRVDGYRDREALHLFRRFCRSGDPDLFRELFEQEAPRLAPAVRLMVARQRSRMDPVELLTDTFAQVFRSRHQFRQEGQGSFRRWFLTIARNLIRQGRRDLERRDRRERGAAVFEPDHASNPYQLLVRQESADQARRACEELRHVVMEGMDALTPATRQVLLLYSVHRWKYREIADSLGLSTSAVAMRIKRARDAVLDHVMRRVTPAEVPEP